MWTYRLKYAKRGRIRFISHLDVMRALARALYRSRLPLVFTEGFNPRPKLSMGPALPLGCESESEFADISLTRDLAPEAVQEQLRRYLPEGLELLATEVVTASSTRLSSASSATYMVKLRRDSFEEVQQRVKEFLEKDSALVERVRKDTSDIIEVKQFVKHLDVETRADCRWLRMEISMGGRGSCSASEVAQAVLHLTPDEAKCLHMTRTGIEFEGRPLRKRVDAKIQEEEVEEDGK
jgi:radical SAM-linked protein